MAAVIKNIEIGRQCLDQWAHVRTISAVKIWNLKKFKMADGGHVEKSKGGHITSTV